MCAYVGVIIPTYNRCDMLSEAIESLLVQDYQYKYLIIVDDGSTDNTEFLCKHWGALYPDTVFYFKKSNGGCSSARNFGLTHLPYNISYICFLDSDDRFLPGAISAMVECLDKEPGVQFCYADWILFDAANGRELHQSAAAAGRPHDFAIEHFLTYQAKPASVMYRASILSGRFFREDLLYNEDSEFLQHIAINYQSTHLSKAVSWVRWHSGSKSRNFLQIQHATIHSDEKLLDCYPDFFDRYRSLINKKMLKSRRDLYIFAMASEEWDLAEAMANTPLKRGLVYFRISILAKLRQRIVSFVKKIRV